MAVIIQGDVPVYNKELGKFVGKYESQKLEEQARKEELIENLKQPTQDFSEFAKGEANKENNNVADTIIADGNDLKTNNSDDEDDLPF